jgi:hypothetical protein
MLRVEIRNVVQRGLHIRGRVSTFLKFHPTVIEIHITKIDILKRPMLTALLHNPDFPAVLNDFCIDFMDFSFLETRGAYGVCFFEFFHNRRPSPETRGSICLFLYSFNDSPRIENNGGIRDGMWQVTGKKDDVRPAISVFKHMLGSFSYKRVCWQNTILLKYHHLSEEATAKEKNPLVL